MRIGGTNMKEEVFSIKIGHTTKIYHAVVYDISEGLKAYRVYHKINNLVMHNHEEIYCCIAGSHEKAERLIQEYFEEQQNRKKEIKELTQDNIRLKAKLDCFKPTFAKCFTITLNAASNDWIQVFRMDTTVGTLYRADRKLTGESYYYMTEKYDQWEIKDDIIQMVKKRIEAEKLTDKLNQWKREGEKTTKANGLYLRYTYYQMLMTEGKSLFKITREVADEWGKWYNLETVMIWEGIRIEGTYDEIVKNMDNTLEEHQASAKEVSDLNKEIEKLERKIEKLEENNIRKLIDWADILEENKKRACTVLRGEAYKRNMQQIEDFERYAEDVINAFI